MAGRASMVNPGLAIGAGVAIGTGLSVALDNWLYLALGISLGVVFGAATPPRGDRQDPDE